MIVALSHKIHQAILLCFINVSIQFSYSWYFINSQYCSFVWCIKYTMYFCSLYLLYAETHDWNKIQLIALITVDNKLFIVLYGYGMTPHSTSICHLCDYNCRVFQWCAFVYMYYTWILHAIRIVHCRVSS